MMLSFGWTPLSGQTVSIKLPTLNLLIQYAEEKKIDSLIIENYKQQSFYRDSIEVKKDSINIVLQQGLVDMTKDRNDCGISLQLANQKLENKNFMLKALGGVVAINLLLTVFIK